MKPGPGDLKLNILITGDELQELKRFTIDMVDAFGLDRRIEAYSGKRSIGFHRWDVDCLLAVIDNALKDERAYPDKTSSAYAAFKRLQVRLEHEYRKIWESKGAVARKAGWRSGWRYDAVVAARWCGSGIS